MEIIPLRSKSACEVAVVVFREVFCALRPSKTDLGGCRVRMEGDFKAMSELLGIAVRVASSGYPTTSEQFERIIRIIKEAFRRYITDFPNNWWDFAPTGGISFQNH